MLNITIGDLLERVIKNGGSLQTEIIIAMNDTMESPVAFVGSSILEEGLVTLIPKGDFKDPIDLFE